LNINPQGIYIQEIDDNVYSIIVKILI